MENMTKYKFTKIKLTKSERIWLEKIYSYDYHIFDDKSTRIDLADKLEKGFDHKKIDYRLLRDGRLTLIGLWHIDHTNKYFVIVTGIILFLKEFLKSYDFGFRLSIKDIIGKVIYEQREISIAFMLMNDLGFFKGGSLLRNSGMDQMEIGIENGGIDGIIYFENIYDVMDEFFIKYPPLKTSHIPSKGIFQMNKNSSVEDVWESIKADYSVTKNIFGKKINFIKDKKVRSILFRDTEQAFLIMRLGFYKPAVILAGGIIEEILRQLLAKKEKFDNNISLIELIRRCKNLNLISIQGNNVSESTRNFRNAVHIHNEVSKENEIIRSVAYNAYSSIFILINGINNDV